MPKSCPAKNMNLQPRPTTITAKAVKEEKSEKAPEGWKEVVRSGRKMAPTQEDVPQKHQEWPETVRQRQLQQEQQPHQHEQEQQQNQQ